MFLSLEISHVSDRTEQPVQEKNTYYNKIDVMQDIDSVSFKCPILASRSFVVCV